MPYIVKKVFTASPASGGVLALIISLIGANADVVSLKSGRQLGGAENFVYWRDRNVVIVHPSGARETIPLKDLVSIKLEGTRNLQFNNGDTLHADNVVIEERSVRFDSKLLGHNTVPLKTVVGISGPAGRRIAETLPRAVQQPALPPKTWRGNVQFGYASTSGRKDTQNANLSAEVVREASKTRLTLSAAGRYGESTGERTVDAQEASGKLDLFLTRRIYCYGDIGLLRDKISLINLRLSPGLGIGRKFITERRFSLEGEAGLTAIWERQALISAEQATESNLYGRAGGRLTWKPGAWAELSQELELLPGLSSRDEFRYRSVSQLKATVTKKLSLATGLTVQYDNNPPADVPRTSTNATTGFIYNF